ncbi:hypothetical protein CLOM_g4625 [Closterium sp. NIES-68]|nr:hypothetical protein CLOM_g4625 [Closterium sp. NIES-68]GJP57558.1 hypothetical protein CLOP_g18791 [Closterium sp. NIES-67]GJP85749.1 hypothetical protein CLOP_g15849 [Closterium sp. NIES-67]
MVLSVALPAGLDASKLSKDISSYSELQLARLKYRPTLPSMLDGPSVVEKGPPTKAAGNDEEIAKLFPSLYGQPSVKLIPAGASAAAPTPITVGVVLSGGQAPGGHNVIAGLYDYLQEKVPGSKLLGFLGGPAGVMKCKYVEITAEFLYPYRNQGGFDIICSGRDKIESPEQFAMAVASAEKLSLDGLVVIGGDDSNTNACLLAEHFRGKGLKTKVIGCPKTIDGDLKAAQVPISFGFDTACKIYSETIGNVMTDARSGGKYYHFVRLMGRAASHITLECALQTHPNITLVGEEVFAKGMTLGQVTNHIADVICKRADAGKNFGVVLIPEGLIDFIPEINDLISQLNEILAKAAVDAEGMYEWKEGLQPNTRTLFDSLPKDIQDQLLLERDPHGNVQVARIETEKMLISMVEEELGRRAKAGQYKGAFEGRSHFCGYEGRCGMPTLFDATYCYALGSVAAALVQAGETGLIASVGNLTAPPQEWTVGGTALTELMVVERRKGKNKPVIKKAMVEFEGAPFKKFVSVRDDWALNDRYRSPGPVQFEGPTASQPNLTLLLEQGVSI